MIQKGVKKANSKPVEELLEDKLIVPMTEAMKEQIRVLAKRENMPMALLVRRFVVAGLSAQGGGL
jgi:hypothetical protein